MLHIEWILLLLSSSSSSLSSSLLPLSIHWERLAVHLLCVHLAIWFHCRGLNFSVFIVSIIFEVHIHSLNRLSILETHRLARSLSLSFKHLFFYIFVLDVSRKLFYQWLAFVFHFNFTIFPFYIDFQCKTSTSILHGVKKTDNRARTIECVCLSVYNMMQPNPFILCMRHLTVFDICKSNATNDITYSNRSQGDLLAFAVVHNIILALYKLYSTMNLSPIKYINNVFNEICSLFLFARSLSLSLSLSRLIRSLVSTADAGWSWHNFSNDNACIQGIHVCQCRIFVRLKLLQFNWAEMLAYFQPNITLNFNELTSSSIFQYWIDENKLDFFSFRSHFGLRSTNWIKYFPKLNESSFYFWTNRSI